MNLLQTKINNNTIYTLSNDWSGSSIHNGTLWEPHVTKFLQRNLLNNSVLIDVGSNYGYHSINSSSLCHLIYSFEPQKYIHDIQLKSIEYNNIHNIKLFNYAIGHYNGQTKMSAIDYDHPSIHMGDLSIGTNGESVDIRTLDSIDIPYANFIKIDVQGYEKYVLEGASTLISNHYPIIIIEIEEHQLARFNYGAKHLFDILKKLGYYIYFLDYHYPSDHVCVHQSCLQDFISKNHAFIQNLTEDNNLNHNIQHGIKEKIIMK